MVRVVCKNPRASRDFALEDRYEAGIELWGSEVKSLRDSQASIKESFAMVREGEVYLVNSYIAPYEGSNQFNHEPRRSRKLLLNKREINKLIGKTLIRGYTIVPLRIYFKNGWAKVEIAIGKGKRTFDKREDIKRREADREMSKAMKRRMK
ncbi:MAG: SsrA-binding protein SmpB [Candidatus Dadabacteria bacterium]|nr:SsrA-binding protein SmpB [Candidatus Dadabacteria bacterium]